jgi:hypothetical protein
MNRLKESTTYFTTIFFLTFSLIAFSLMYTFDQFKGDRSNFSVSSIEKFYKDEVEKKFLLKLSFVANRVLNKSDFANVHFGKDGWLFYFPTSDGQTKNDLLGLNLKYEKINTYWKERLELYERAFTNNKIKWGVILAPNKSRIYSEFLNFHAPIDLDLGSYDRSYRDFGTVLSEVNSQVPFVSPEKIIGLKKEEPKRLYHKTDTHWNLLGAKKAYNLVAPSMSLPIVDLEQAGTTVMSGDILKMLPLPRGGSRLYHERSGIYKINQGNCGFVEYSKLVRIYSCKKPLSDKALMLVGDSFRGNIMHVVKRHFSEVIMIHSNVFSEALVSELKNQFDIDSAILVRVERYIRK